MKKALLVAFLLVFSVAVIGKIAVAKDSDPVLEKRKAAMLKATEEKKACLDTATDLAAINACSQHEAMAFNPMQQMEDDFVAHFKERKENILKNIDAGIKKQQQDRDCFKAADDIAALKVCSPAALMMGNAMPMMPPGGMPPSHMMPAGMVAPEMPPAAPAPKK